MSQYVQTDTNGRKYIVNCCERCGKITEGIHTCTPNLVIERLTVEREQAALKMYDLVKQLTETRDLAEHWAILAEQRRVELGECRKDAERLAWILMQGDEFSLSLIMDAPGDGDYFCNGAFSQGQGATPREAIDAAMKEAKP